MKIFSALFIIVLFVIAGCGTGSQESDSGLKEKASELAANHREAMNRFIDGTAAEAKGDYAAAIIEYQDALNFQQSAGIYYSIAKNYFFLGKLAGAVDNARTAVKLDSTSVEYLLLLQEIYSSSHLQDSALITLEKILKIDSTRAEALFKLAQLSEKTRPQQAINIYKKLIKYNGPDWNVLARIGELYERLGNINGAIKTIEELLELIPESKQLETMLVVYYTKASLFDKAHSKLDELIQFYPEDDELVQLKGETLIKEGKVSDAAEYYRRLLALPQTTLDAKIRIGAYFYTLALKDTTLMESASLIFESIDRDTTDWMVKLHLGAISAMRGKDSIAISQFEKAAELAPWNADAWVRLASLLFDSKRYKEVVTALGHVIDKFPEEFPLHLILGLSYAQLNNFEDAVTYLAKAVELKGKDINAIGAYSYALNKIEDYKNAIIWLKKGLAIEPASVELMANLGLLYDEHNMNSECDSIYSAALKVNPDNAIILNNYAYSLSKRSYNLDEALEMVSRALEKEPDNPSYLDTKGWVYYKMGNYPDAKKFIEESLKFSSDKSVILDHLAEVVYAMGNRTEAISIWKRALELSPDNTELKQKIERGKP